MFKVGDRVETLDIGVGSKIATIVGKESRTTFRVEYDNEYDEFFRRSGRLRYQEEMTLIDEPSDPTEEFFR